MSITWNQRYEDKGSNDMFPTPPWCVRALFEHVLYNMNDHEETFLETAAGFGHMMETIREYGHKVDGVDIEKYEGALPEIQKQNFLDPEYKPEGYPYHITNPPFNQAEDFFEKSQEYAEKGVIFFIRLTWLTTSGRYERIFKDNPPNVIAQFAERVSLYKGRVIPLTSGYIDYVWLFWEKQNHGYQPKIGPGSKTIWIPKCFKELEKPEDYWNGSLPDEDVNPALKAFFG